MFRRLTAISALAALLAGAAPALAQTSSGPGYFIPHAAAPAAAAHKPAKAAEPAPGGITQNGMTTEAAGNGAAGQPELPAIPVLPALPKEAPPPAPVMGVLSVPQVMQNSTAAQGVQNIIQARQGLLRQEAQADRTKWEKQQAAINAEKGKLSQDQLKAKITQVQSEIQAAQVKLSGENQGIENSAKIALGKIESTLIAVIRQVSQAHGMNLVLHRSQVALNVNEFDITKEVTDQLNKLLPSVEVPPTVIPKHVATDSNMDPNQFNGQDPNQDPVPQQNQ